MRQIVVTEIETKPLHLLRSDGRVSRNRSLRGCCPSETVDASEGQAARSRRELTAKIAEIESGRALAPGSPFSFAAMDGPDAAAPNAAATSAAVCDRAPILAYGFGVGEGIAGDVVGAAGCVI